MEKLTIVFLLSLLLTDCTYKRTAISDVAIVNVTVIDATGTQAQSDMTVLITGDTITDLIPGNRVKIDSRSRIVDGKGKYLIPGLWDMHVHGSADTVFSMLAIANGVTSVREMFNNRESYPYYVNWRRNISEKKILAPNSYFPLANMGPDQNWFSSIIIKTNQEAIDFVQEAKKLKVDFIKIFDLYDHDIIFTLLSEAKKNGIRVAGHCPLSLNCGEAAEAGLQSFEHLYEMMLSCSSKEDIIRNAMIKESKRIHDSFSDLSRLLFFVQPKEIITTYDTAKAEQLFNRLKNSGSFQCPTLVVFQGKLKVIDSEIISEERKKYVADDCLKNWTSLKTNPFSASVTEEDYEPVRQIIERRTDLIKELNLHGIPFLAGTDAGSGCTHHNLVPGFSLHDELALLVKVGLSPMEAIQAATRNAADAMGELSKTGTIEPGKCADLVLLDANPLEDINNTTKIDAVIRAGRYISGEELNQILRKAEMMVHETH